MANPATTAWTLMGDALTDLAYIAESDLKANGGIYLDGSPAKVESEHEAFAGTWSDRPTHHSYAQAILLATAAADHLFSAGTLLRADVHPVYGLAALARCSMEAAAKSWYLLDATIDPLERVRRYMNLRLESLHEQRLMQEGVGVDASELIATAQAILDEASVRGLVTRAAVKHRPACIGEPLMPRVRLADHALGDIDHVPMTVYRQLTAVVHATGYGLAELIEPLPGNTGVNRFGRISFTEAQCAIWFCFPVFTYIVAGRRLHERFSWDGGDWDRAAAHAVNVFTAIKG